MDSRQNERDASTPPKNRPNSPSQMTAAPQLIPSSNIIQNDPQIIEKSEQPIDAANSPGSLEFERDSKNQSQYSILRHLTSIRNICDEFGAKWPERSEIDCTGNENIGDEKDLDVAASSTHDRCMDSASKLHIFGRNPTSKTFFGPNTKLQQSVQEIIDQINADRHHMNHQTQKNIESLLHVVRHSSKPPEQKKSGGLTTKKYIRRLTRSLIYDQLGPNIPQYADLLSSDETPESTLDSEVRESECDSEIQESECDSEIQDSECDSEVQESEYDSEIEESEYDSEVDGSDWDSGEITESEEVSDWPSYGYSSDSDEQE